jgi:hypothetical protein
MLDLVGSVVLEAGPGAEEMITVTVAGMVVAALTDLAQVIPAEGAVVAVTLGVAMEGVLILEEVRIWGLDLEIGIALQLDAELTILQVGTIASNVELTKKKAQELV